ncbi:uncharacterized protein [Watersipora subatra]|uniref:uncharacterized protein n=1 Tax=Watersipora subatra TaxID=2589382 RepID=UPI00355C12FA
MASITLPVSRTTVLMYAHPSMHNLASSIVKVCTDPASLGDLCSRSDQGAALLTPKTSFTCEDFKNEQLGLAELSTSLSASRYASAPRKVLFKDDIKWEHFADGFPKLFIDNVKNLAGRDVIFIGSFHSPDAIFEQLSVIYAIPRYLARSVIFILPFFPTGTMERVDREGQIATAKTLATLLSNIPLTARGPTQIMLFDIHALQERFYFSDTVIPRLETAIPLLLRKLKMLPHKSNISIAFPDDGAMKRFGDMFSDYKTIICAKVRNGDQRNVVVKDGDPSGQDIIIVDDLVQTGGTLIECAKACLSKGAKQISCFVTHAVFPNNSWSKFTHESQHQVRFEEFWITDSIPHSAEIVKHAPFQLLSLCDVIADRLLGYDLVPSI